MLQRVKAEFARQRAVTEFGGDIGRAVAGVATLPSGDVVLVVLSGTIRAVLAVALDLASDGALRFVIDPLSLTRIDRLTNGWRAPVGAWLLRCTHNR